jgi:tRNA pseudouridine38-40 synthase
MTYKLTIAYDGTRYKGWQRLKNNPLTIQQKLEEVISRIFNEPIELIGSGRTDGGVHALGQVASFSSEKVFELNRLLKEINRYLPEDISIKHVESAAPRFHARFNAIKKTYTYQVWTSEIPPVFERLYVHQIHDGSLELNRMKKASEYFVGKHDFRGFTTDKTKKSTTRNIERIEFVQDGPILKIIFVGDGFLYNMVRILVGTLLEVGLGTRDVDSILKVYESGDRSLAGETAPAKGLFLTEVFYENY